VWSLDRTRIAFASTKFGRSDVFVMAAAGGTPVRLTTNPADDYHPTWSPDGSRIAFESLRDGNAEIYVMNADGTDQTRLTRNAGLDGSPTWSPDGRTIAFTSSRFGAPRVFVMNADGTGQVAISPLAGRSAGGGTGIWMDANPAWSPDGAWLAFATTRPGTLQIWAMHPDGGNPQALTRFGNNGAPSWA
jgi:Tol biopolymer transport system component